MLIVRLLVVMCRIAITGLLTVIDLNLTITDFVLMPARIVQAQANVSVVRLGIGGGRHHIVVHVGKNIHNEVFFAFSLQV